MTITGYVLAGALYLGASFLVAVPVAILAAAIAAGLMERIAFRPLRGASPVVMILTSFAISGILQTLFQTLISPRALPVAVPPGFNTLVKLGGLEVGMIQIVAMGLSLAGLAALSALYYRSRTGAALRAAAEDFDTLRLMGMNSDRLVVTLFMLSGLLAGWPACFGCSSVARLTP